MGGLNKFVENLATNPNLGAALSSVYSPGARQSYWNQRGNQIDASRENSEKNQAMMAAEELAQTLRGITDPQEMQAAAAQILGKYDLGANAMNIIPQLFDLAKQRFDIMDTQQRRKVEDTQWQQGFDLRKDEFGLSKDLFGYNKGQDVIQNAFRERGLGQEKQRIGIANEQLKISKGQYGLDVASALNLFGISNGDKFTKDEKIKLALQIDKNSRGMFAKERTAEQSQAAIEKYIPYIDARTGDFSTTASIAKGLELQEITVSDAINYFLKIPQEQRDMEFGPSNKKDLTDLE